MCQGILGFNFHNYDSMVHNECPKFDPRHRIGERERAAVVSLLFAAKAADLNTIRRFGKGGHFMRFDPQIQDVYAAGGLGNGRL